ncbi:hypothetical protein [Ralstonia pseudosolanacearum]|uniref:hypothetical protein n=1 Tax=Ralstonia pseudosolanacearum TaxID=1310165 RepID=UPI00048ABC8B|nr:hypothetical protein [Ralstonia pseudosolanacearum]
MTRAKMTLWQTIGTLTKSAQCSQTKIENLLSTQLTETDEGGNDVFQFFKSTPIKLSDGVVIENVDLRIKRAGPHPGFLVLSIGGSCIGIDAVRAHYNDLKITDTPRGHSRDEVTSHSAMLRWGELSFSFKERNPNCLASIAFDPK